MSQDPLESKVEEDLKKAVKAAKGLCIKLPAILYIGIPDRLVLLPGGRMFFVELKRAKKGRVSAMQDRFRETLCSMGFTCVILKGRPDLDNFVRTHVEARL